MSEPKLQRNSSLWEWQWVHLEPEVAFLSGKYIKADGKQKQKWKTLGKTWKSNNETEIYYKLV